MKSQKGWAIIIKNKIAVEKYGKFLIHRTKWEAHETSELIPYELEILPVIINSTKK